MVRGKFYFKLSLCGGNKQNHFYCCLDVFKVEGGVFFQEMVPMSQSHSARATQIGKAQLVAAPRGLQKESCRTAQEQLLETECSRDN